VEAEPLIKHFVQIFKKVPLEKNLNTKFRSYWVWWAVEYRRGLNCGGVPIALACFGFEISP
jgi:hypothetical protein